MVTRFSLVFSLLVFLLVGSSSARTWTDAKSGRKIEADFVSADEKNVTFVLQSGQKFTIEIARLSAEDQAFVKEQLKPETAALSSVAEDRFKELPRMKVDEIPVDGEGHDSLVTVDEVIKSFMAEKGIGAVSFALSKDGEILHDRAFGWGDADLKEPLSAGVKMRVASMTKPVVQAAIKTLISSGKLKEDDLVYTVLDLGQYEEAKDSDERLKQVTIQHLLDHKAGWDRDQSGDFTFDDGIHDQFRIDLDEMTAEHVMRYGLTKKLDSDPGAKYAYCNFGYILLVRVVEKVSGQTFIDYLQSTVCQEAKTPSFSLSRSDAVDRQAGEVWYNYYPEYDRKEVPLPFRTEARHGAGALACTAADYCRFYDRYTVTGGLRRAGGNYRGSFSGSHPGVTAISSQRVDGINYAIICNGRGGSNADWNDELRKQVDEALEKVAADL